MRAVNRYDRRWVAGGWDGRMTVRVSVSALDMLSSLDLQWRVSCPGCRPCRVGPGGVETFRELTLVTPLVMLVLERLH